MLDVHPPHAPTHTWRDFLIHIATIVVGLLIAVALEQTVEYIHHRREAAELREALHHESEQVLEDSNRTDRTLNYQLHWLAARIEQVKQTVWNGQPLASPAVDTQPGYASPDIPLWRSAKASGLTPRLHQDEINAFSEVEYVQTKVLNADDAFGKARSARDQFESQFPTLPSHAVDLTKASANDMRTYLSLLSAENESTQDYRLWVHVLIGAEQAILNGRLTLKDIYGSERKSIHAFYP